MAPVTAHGRVFRGPVLARDGLADRQVTIPERFSSERSEDGRVVVDV